MAIERENAPIDLEIEPNSAQEIDAPLMEGDAMMLVQVVLHTHY
jgi:hypothetical protein